MTASVDLRNRGHKDESQGRYILHLLVPLQGQEAHMYLTSSVLSVTVRQYIIFKQRDMCLTRSKSITPPRMQISVRGGKNQPTRMNEYLHTQ